MEILISSSRLWLHGLYEPRCLKGSLNTTQLNRVTHICVGNLTIVGSDNGMASGRRQAFIWINAGMFIGPLGTNFSEILIEIHIFSFKKMHLKMLKFVHFYSTKCISKCGSQNGGNFVAASMCQSVTHTVFTRFLCTFSTARRLTAISSCSTRNNDTRIALYHCM